MIGPVVLALEAAGRGFAFAGRAAVAAAAALGRPAYAAAQFFPVLLGALPLGLLAGLTLGVVVWLHTYGLLSRHGDTKVLPTMLAVAVMLELAPISAGLILAARTGASLGAELAAMRVTEQVDALEVLGLSSWRELVGPRVLACVVAMPLLDVFIVTTAILGGFAAESAGGSMNWLQYRDAAFDGRFLRLGDVVAATLKTSVFGFLVGATGCYAGLTAYGGSEAVGRAATRGVVWSIVLVLLADVALVGVIQLAGGMKLP